MTQTNYIKMNAYSACVGVSCFSCAVNRCQAEVFERNFEHFTFKCFTHSFSRGWMAASAAWPSGPIIVLNMLLITFSSFATAIIRVPETAFALEKTLDVQLHLYIRYTDVKMLQNHHGLEVK